MRLRLALLAIIVVAGVLLSPTRSVRAEVGPPNDALAERVGSFFTTYCVDCHSGGDAAEAGVDFEQGLSLRHAQSNPARWRQILGLIEQQAMPPAEYEPQPPAAERAAAVEAINDLLNRVDCTAKPDPGRVTMRRLNAAEFDNTVQDLFGIDFEPSRFVGLPEDNVGNGFDNQGAVLNFSPLLLEKYLDAAEAITDRVIVFDREALSEQELGRGRAHVGESIARRFWVGTGDYEITYRLSFGWGETKHAVPVRVYLDGELIGEEQADQEWRRVSLNVPLEQGEHTLSLRFENDPQGNRPSDDARQVRVKEIRVTGPADGPPVYPPPHTTLIAATPGPERSVRQAARQNFERFLPRAYRRTVTANEVEQHVDLVASTVRQGGAFEEGMARGVQAALLSPHFLFRVEAIDSGRGPTPLDDFELANRLSFFVWASMPDGELLDRAEQHELARGERLEQEARRLLASPNANALVDRFFTQWLGLVDLDQATPDGEKFKLWNSRLRAAMREETLHLVRHVLREDLSLFALFDAEYTFVNPRLAELYDVEFRGQDPYHLYLIGSGREVNEEQLRKRQHRSRSRKYLHEEEWVRVPAPPGRRGVLTHASILTLTSNPRTTSPVQRGHWVLDTVLGEPPPPAPPGVPPLEDVAEQHGEKSLREQLAVHRRDPACASCHKQMDPIGLAFENFDGIGRWRASDKNGHAVDPSGELDGQAFGGPLELITLLREREETLAANFARELMVYAIGRGLRPDDQCAIDEIVKAAAADNYRLSTFVLAMVNSEPFRFHGEE